MSTLEIIATFFGSTLFLSTLAVFFRLGHNQGNIESAFKRNDEKFEAMEKRLDRIETDIHEMRKDVARIDKEVAIITATLRFNNFDLDRHKVEGE